MQGYERVTSLVKGLRRPAARLALGVVLIAPAAAFTGGRQLERWDGIVHQERVERAQRIVAREAVISSWNARAEARERERQPATFAHRFRISLSLAKEIHRAALEHGVDPEIAFRLVRAESSFRPRVVSPVGAVGLTQVMPETANWLEPGISDHALMEPRTNLRLGFRYLRMLLDRYEGDTDLALTAYNRGPGLVDRMLKVGSNPRNGYAELVRTGSSPLHAAFMKSRLDVLRRGET